MVLRSYAPKCNVTVAEPHIVWHIYYTRWPPQNVQLLSRLLLSSHFQLH